MKSICDTRVWSIDYFIWDENTEMINTEHSEFDKCQIEHFYDNFNNVRMASLANKHHNFLENTYTEHRFAMQSTKLAIFG